MPESHMLLQHWLMRLSWFLLPSLLVMVSAFIEHPAAVALILLAHAAYLPAATWSLGYELEDSMVALILRRGLTFLLLSASYGLVAFALVALPSMWLLREGSLQSVLALGTSLVAGWLLGWRWWPAFGLVLIWDDAYARTDEGEPTDDAATAPAFVRPRRSGQGSWLLGGLRRSLAAAARITRRSDVYFSHGLYVCIALSVLNLGAVVLGAGRQWLDPSIVQFGHLLYAFVLAPLAAVLVIERSVSMLDRLPAREDPALSENRESAPAAEPESQAVPADAIEPISVEDREPELEGAPPAASAAELARRLLEAIRKGRVDEALGLLGEGADPNARPEPGEPDQRTPLLIAATLIDARLLRDLISRGARVADAVNQTTALHAAAHGSYAGRADAVMTLLTNGADPRAADAEGNTALHLATLGGESTVVCLLMDNAAPLDAVNHAGMTALGIALSTRRVDLARVLLERGARVDAPNATPAIVAAAQLDEDDCAGIDLLAKRRVAVDARDRIGRSALMTAALLGHAKCVARLLKAGADPDLADVHGTRALMEAARAGSAEIVQQLLAAGAAADACDQLGRSALLIACGSRSARPEVVRRLLEAGADRTLTDREGRCARDLALSAGRWNLVALIDPGYELPAGVRAHLAHLDESADEDIGRDQQLLEALRARRGAFARELLELEPAMAPAELAETYLAIAGEDQAVGWALLIEHGVDARSVLDSGEPLLIALPARPGTRPGAVLALLDQGPDEAVPMHALHAVLESSLATEKPLLQALARLPQCAAAARADGQLPLHVAARAINSSAVEALLAAGCDVAVTNAEGDSALHVAVRIGEPALACVRELIRAGADPDRANGCGQTALGIALEKGSTALVDWLDWPGFRLPARVLQPADLADAARVGDVRAVRRLLALGFAADAADAQGCPALVRAAGEGHEEVLRALVESGASLDARSTQGIHALWAAVAGGRHTSLALLCAAGADPEADVHDGLRPLHLAASLVDPQACAILLEANAQIDATDQEGRSALLCMLASPRLAARAQEGLPLLRRLLDGGANPNRVDSHGANALMLLFGNLAFGRERESEAGMIALADLLRAAGIRLDHAESFGWTALHVAAQMGRVAAVEWLLRCGADPASRDRQSRSPRDIAQSNGYADLARMLDDTPAPPPADLGAVLNRLRRR